MTDAHIHDPELLDALEAMAPVPYEGYVWRVTWADRDPLSGGSGGGRWHPPNDFEVLYTSLEEDGALAEIYYHLSRAPIFSTSHVKINKIQVSTERTLVFPDIASLLPMSVTEDAFRKGEISRTREIGAAARFLDLEGLIVPSARSQFANLVLILDRMDQYDSLVVAESRDVNWPAWREKFETE